LGKLQVFGFGRHRYCRCGLAQIARSPSTRALSEYTRFTDKGLSAQPYRSWTIELFEPRRKPARKLGRLKNLTVIKLDYTRWTIRLEFLRTLRECAT